MINRRKKIKEIVIFGLGRLGNALAEDFSSRGGQVVAIDNDQKKVDEIADKVAYALRADVMDTDSIKGISFIKNVDAAIIAMSGNFEATIMAVILCKELGINKIIAKAQNEIQANVLEKMGADRVIFPEEEVGKRLSLGLLYGNFIDIMTLSDDISIVDIDIPSKWIGKTLIQLDLRRKYGFNVIAIREENDITTDIKIDEPLKAGMEMVIVGESNKLNTLLKKEKR
ncbi:MAG: TrkA family potassium uptake protein [Lachnospiraceae bacterium]|nr:TrkA family potassium uptake protein [Lachnospiraceae bacterium]